QLSARPDRKRLRVSFTPVGEIATVKGSPSISISRRISFKSFVAMCSYTPALGGRLPSPGLRQVSRRLLRSRRKNVLRVPLPAMLAESGITDETGFHQHYMGWLKDALQVRRILLYQRQHVAQPLQ